VQCFAVDEKEKFIWYTKSGEEQFFDLVNDPGECANRIADPACRERVQVWQDRLIAKLARRPQDGLSDGKRMLPGKNLPATRPELKA